MKRRRRVASDPGREFWAAMRELRRRLEQMHEQWEREQRRAQAEREREKAERERERQRAQAEREREKAERERERQRARAERETERQQAQAERETERQQAQAEREREQAERERQWARRRAEADARLRRAEQVFTGNWGKLVESLVEGDLARLLQERKVDVVAVTSRLELKSDPLRREIDLIALNHEDAVLVEVKTTLKVGDVRRYLELLDEVRPLLPTVFRRLRIYGGVAYLRAEEEAARFAERKGLFVVRATGNSASIINRLDFRPRQFDPAGAPDSP